MTVRTATQFCLLVECRLGWDPYRLAKEQGKDVYKIRGAEAGKINKKVATDPGLYSWENLELAVAYLFRKRIPVQTPTAVCWYVEEALKLAERREPLDDLGARVTQAIATEMARDDAGSQEWIGRLARSTGVGREEVLAQWRQERG
ncbi:MAG: hypothetical protein ACXVYY_00960 [Oryzihumus sp.]